MERNPCERVGFALGQFFYVFGHAGTDYSQNN